MHELQTIVNAFADIRQRGERAALATVIHVIGSAYRRPGAKLLITEAGNTIGSISGGCLERDVAERALKVIATGLPTVIEYDTRGDEDIVWGMGLGCNGVVKIHLESAHEDSSAARALQFTGECLAGRRRGVIATLLHCAPITGSQIKDDGLGQRLIFDEDLNQSGHLSQSFLETQVRTDAGKALLESKPTMHLYETRQGLSEVFFDVILPPRALVIFGAEHDALPVLKLAQSLGWHAIVVDTKARSVTAERFGQADRVLLCRPEEFAGQVPLTSTTAVVVMTHNYLHDVELMKVLLPSPVCYLGILGPRQRTMKLLAEVRAASRKPPTFNLGRLHSPIGLDIGAETPEEIALSILSEIQAACAGQSAGFLRDRPTAIHQDSPRKAAIGASGLMTSGRRDFAAESTCHLS